jgi:hypothetical protein
MGEAPHNALPGKVLPCEQRLQALWQATALTRPEFDRHYQPLIDAVAHALTSHPVDATPHPITTGMSDWLDQALALLRRRQAIILPRRGTAEQVATLMEVYSYALMTALALETVATYLTSITLDPGSVQEGNHPLLCGCFHSSHRAIGPGQPLPGGALVLAPQVIPPSGWLWLHRFPQVLADLLAYFAAPAFSDLYWLAHGTCRDEPSTAATGNTKPKSPGEPVIPANPTPRKRAGGWDVVERIKAALTQGDLTANAPNSLIHSDPAGQLLLLAPEIFVWYEARAGVPAKTAQNRFIRLGLHRIKSNKMNIYTGRYPDSKTKYKGLLVADGGCFGSHRPKPGSILIT